MSLGAVERAEGLVLGVSYRTALFDAATIRRHLEVLRPADAELYRMLSRSALELARLDPERRGAIEDLLGPP